MNKLYFGDNLDVLREYVEDNSVDVIYLDPPFNSQAAYNVLFQSPQATTESAQAQAFRDTWRWGDEAEWSYNEVMRAGGAIARFIDALRSALQESDMMAYLCMMAVRLYELHRKLRATGSLYLHCDPTASHYLKILLDGIFGPENFLNEVVWKRTFAHNSANRYGPVHDVILFYAKAAPYFWGQPRTRHDPAYIDKHFTMIDAVGGRFQPITLTGSGVRQGRSGQAWRGVNPTDVGRHWALPGDVLNEIGVSSGTVHDRLDALDAAGRIFWPNAEGSTPRLKWYVSDLKGVAIPIFGPTSRRSRPMPRSGWAIRRRSRSRCWIVSCGPRRGPATSFSIRFAAAAPPSRQPRAQIGAGSASTSRCTPSR